eukprot:gene2443-13307_t
MLLQAGTQAHEDGSGSTALMLACDNGHSTWSRCCCRLEQISKPRIIVDGQLL